MAQQEGFRAVRRPRDAAADREGDRACGPCTLCCTLLRVDELDKLGGEPCPQLAADGSGCGIHATRPTICRRYRCLWLQGGLEEADRPDRVGAVLDLLTTAGTTHLAVRLASPDGYETSPRLREIAERFRAAMPVRITDSDDPMDPETPVRILLPEGDEHRVRGDEIRVFRDGREVARRRLPLVQRAARRVMMCAHALRIAWRRR